MTAIFGWQDGPDVFLIGDSAVTSSGPPRGATSSFGEAVLHESVTVEERAIKILQLPRNVIVGVSGDSRAATSYLALLTRDLAGAATPVREILAELAQVFRGHERRFRLLVGYPHDGGMALTIVGTAEPVLEDVVDAVSILGSLPASKQSAAAQLIGTIRKHELPPAARLAAAVGLLQAGGITDYLPAYRVGGAFFGVRSNADAVEWQPDMLFFVYPPRFFEGTPIVVDGEASPNFTDGGQVGKVRVLVREGAGIVLSSLGRPGGRVFVPPGSMRTDREWMDLVLTATPPPFEIVAPCRFYSFLNTSCRKAAFYGQLGPDVAGVGVDITGPVGSRKVHLAPRVVQTLEDVTPPGYFDFSLMTEDANGVACTTYRLHEVALE